MHFIINHIAVISFINGQNKLRYLDVDDNIFKISRSIAKKIVLNYV